MNKYMIFPGRYPQFLLAYKLRHTLFITSHISTAPLMKNGNRINTKASATAEDLNSSVTKHTKSQMTKVNLSFWKGQAQYSPIKIHL